MEKGLLQSLTIRGVLVMFIPHIFKFFGVELPDAGAQTIVEGGTLVIGLGAVVIGRVRAGGIKGLWRRA